MRSEQESLTASASGSTANTLSGLIGRPRISGLRPEHFLGAANEHRVASFFLAQGFAVYWPAVQQSHVDFVAGVDAALLRVQVKTGTWSKSGKFKYLQARLLPYGVRKADREFSPSQMYDLLVVVTDIGWWMIPADRIDTTDLCLASTGPKEYRRWDAYRVENNGRY